MTNNRVKGVSCRENTQKQNAGDLELPKPRERMEWAEAKMNPEGGKVYVEAQRETKHSIYKTDV